MLSWHNIITITKKELRQAFDSPTAYIVLAVFLLLWEYLFFRNVFLIGEASLRGLLELLPWLSLLLIPALTMGSFAQEQSEGTLEFLLTRPLADLELLLGKFLASFAFVAIALLALLPIAGGLSLGAQLDWGVVAGQYLSGLLLGAVLISLGLWISSLLRHQVAALLVSAAAALLLVISGSGLVSASLPLGFTPILERLSVLSHAESLGRGVLDLRDLWYALSALAVFGSLTYLQLRKRRFGNVKSRFRREQLGVALLIGIAVLTNVAGNRIPGRLDLTQQRQYTLSQGTRQTLAKLTDVVNITLYSSKALPAQFQPLRRDVQDTLRDYQNYGQGNVQVRQLDPADDPQIAQQANILGIREAQFNVVKQGEFQVKAGYFGLAIAANGSTETLPFIKDTSDLEYQLTSAIAKLTAKERKSVRMLTGHGEKKLNEDYASLRQELAKQFEVSELTLTEGDPVPNGTAALVIAGPTEEIKPKTRNAIKEYLDAGGAALLLLTPVTVNPEGLTANPNERSFSDFAMEYGVAVRPDLVYDLQSHETVRFSSGQVSYFLAYPFWPRAGQTASASPISANIQSIVLPWASSLAIDDAKLQQLDLTVTKLYQTTPYAGLRLGTFNLRPDQQLPSEGLSQQLLAAAVSGAPGQNGKPRLVVVGNASFLADDFLRNAPENLAFGLSAVSWLAQEESLAGIKLKQAGPAKLAFGGDRQIALVKYGNLALALLLPAAFGAYRLLRRRRLRKRGYGG